MACIRRTPKLVKKYWEKAKIMRFYLIRTPLWHGHHMAPNYLSSICVKMWLITLNIPLYTHANCEYRAPSVLPGQVWHQLIFPGVESIWSLNMQGLCNWGACVIRRWSSNLYLMFAQAVIFMYTPITQLFPLVITSPLHNHKQDVGNIGVWDQFLSIWRHFWTSTNSWKILLACIRRTTLRQKLEEKRASYTQVYTVQ